jgi:hypothetical protein
VIIVDWLGSSAWFIVKGSLEVTILLGCLPELGMNTVDRLLLLWWLENTAMG